MADSTSPGLLTVEEARSRILALVSPLSEEEIPIEDGLGRCLVAPAVAPHPLPRFDNSSMDGYALRSADLNGDFPVRLRVVGEVRAGEVAPSRLEPGTAFRIMTGAPVPLGADAIAPVEIASEAGDEVEVRSAPRSSYIRPAGDDVAEGEALVEAGRQLGPGELALLAAVGLSPLRVHRVPRVACVTTGDELVAPEEEPGPGRIRDSNGIALDALAREAGAVVSHYVRIPDDPDDVEHALSDAASSCDLVVSAGGVSVGRHDYVRDVVERRGRVDLWRVAMQPGKPLLAGTFGDTAFVGLPGNPVSVHVGFEQFVRPAIRRMLGCRDLLRPVAPARLSQRLTKPAGRVHLVRVRLEWQGDRLVATPTGPQGSHIQSSLVGSHGLARFEADETVLEEGAEVQVEVWLLPGR